MNVLGDLIKCGTFSNVVPAVIPVTACPDGAQAMGRRLSGSDMRALLTGRRLFVVGLFGLGDYFAAPMSLRYRFVLHLISLSLQNIEIRGLLRNAVLTCLSFAIVYQAINLMSGTSMLWKKDFLSWIGFVVGYLLVSICYRLFVYLRRL